MIRQCSSCCKSEYKNKEVASLGIRNMPSLINWDYGSIDWDAFLQNLIKAYQSIKPIKWFGFQI